MKQPQKKSVKKPPPDNVLTDGFKLDFITGFWGIVLSLLVYGVAAMLLQRFYNPDTSQAHIFAKKVLIGYNPETCKPEPKEQMFFFMGVFTITLSLVLFYWLFKKIRPAGPFKHMNLYYIGTLCLGFISLTFITVKGLMGANPFGGTYLNYMDYICKTNWAFYFKDTFLYDHLYIYILLIYPCILFFFLYPFSFNAKTFRFLNISQKILVYGFCSIIIFLLFLITSFRFPYAYENKYDFNAVFYSVVQVYNGMPLLVDNFMNTYGLYPHFIVPVMKLLGGSIYSFSLIMAFLSIVCFAFLFYVIKQTVSNLFLVLFGFCSVFFMFYMYGHIALNFDVGYSGVPIRYLLYFGLLFYGSVYLKSKAKWLYYLSFFLFSLGILWNPDFGIFCFASLLAFYMYLELESKDLFVIIWKSLQHLIIAGVTLGLTAAAYMLTIKLFYGVYPDFSMLFSTIKVFSMVGNNMLPITTQLHPWMLVVFIYVAGLAYSAYHFIDKKYTYRSGMVFLITVSGITLFTYYMGRSHNWNLLSACPSAFILLAIFADELLGIIKKHRIFYIPFSYIIFMLAFSLFQTLYDYKRITDLVNETQNKELNKAEDQEIIRNGGFIKENTTERERILILTKAWYQSLYFNLSKTVSAINPGLGDLFLKEDNERIVNWIKDNRQSKIFFDQEGFSTGDVRYYAYMSALYDVKKSQGPGGKLVMLTPLVENKNSTFILKQEPQSLVHELFDKDLTNKLSYALGAKGKIITNDHFSVEIIFKPGVMPSGRATRSQTLVYNIYDSAGFGVQQNDTSRSQYLICVGQRCMTCPVVPGIWNYIAFDINKNVITAYSNGRLVGQAVMPNAYVSSQENLYIGNIKNSGGFFFGEIKEVKISNSPLVTADMQSAWNLIEKKVNEPQL